jgi:hypothetical protein
MDNDKIYDLLTKMYSEFNKRFDKIENYQLTLENRFEDTRKVLFDSYTQSNDRLNRIEKRFDDIFNNTELHDVEIKVIKGGKK